MITPLTKSGRPDKRYSKSKETLSTPIEVSNLTQGGLNTDAVLYSAIMFYSVSCFQTFNHLTYEQGQEAALAASEASQRNPLWMRNAKGNFDQYNIPHFGMRSSVYVMAILSAWLVWMQKEIYGNPLPSSPLLEASENGLGLFNDKDLTDYWRDRKHADNHTSTP